MKTKPLEQGNHSEGGNFSAKTLKVHRKNEFYHDRTNRLILDMQVPVVLKNHAKCGDA